MRIEAKTLEEAYEIAAKKLNCSVANLNAKIIQYPSKGFFGLFSKPAIIEVDEIVQRDIEDVIEIVEKDLKRLFSKSCYNIKVVEVSKFDEETIFIKLDGEDVALLIGKEGFRYNALNYILYHYVFQKFGFKVKLEIAEFLKMQQEMLQNFLQPLIEEIKQKGYGKTKPLNGVLSYLALEILRKEFPNKYVALRGENEKYVVVKERNDNSSNSNT